MTEAVLIQFRGEGALLASGNDNGADDQRAPEEEFDRWNNSTRRSKGRSITPARSTGGAFGFECHQ